MSSPPSNFTPGLVLGFSHENYGYAGFGGDNLNHNNVFWKFDPISNTWNQLASLPESAGYRYDAIGGVGLVNGKGFVGLGRGFNDFWLYDFGKDEWEPSSTLYDFPKELTAARTFTFNGDIYVGYGSDLSAKENFDIYKFNPCNSFPSNLDSGIIAHYPFGSGSVDDYSGNNHHLINVNAAISVEDRFGNPNCAFRFNNMPSSNDQYLTTANTAFLDGLSEFSISLWYKPLEDRNPGAFEALVNRDLGLSCPDRLGQWSVGLYDNRSVVFGRESSVWEDYDNVSTNTGEWGYITATYNQVNNTMKLYINGELKDIETGRAKCSSNSYATSKDIGDLFIGKMFTGVIDDVLIYNREVSPCEVTELYNSETMCGVSTSLNGEDHSIKNSALLFYPNPMSNNFTTNLSTEELGGRLEIYSINGENLLLINVYDGQSINLSQLTSGMYIIQYKKDSSVKIGKLIKQ